MKQLEYGFRMLYHKERSVIGMLPALKFDPVAVQKAEHDYKKLSLTKEQRQMIEGAAKIYTQYLPLSEMAVQGYIYFAMRDWQLEHKIDIKETIQWPLEKQVDLAEQVGVLLEERMVQSLKDQKQKQVLKEAIAKAVSFFKENIHRLSR